MLNLWGVRSVIATGVASQQHGIWKTDGYQWWNALGREFVAYLTKSINRRLLVQFFDIWWIITGVPRVNSFDELCTVSTSVHCCHSGDRGGGSWKESILDWAGYVLGRRPRGSLPLTTGIQFGRRQARPRRPRNKRPNRDNWQT